MRYKTISLRLLEDRPELYERLRQCRILLAFIDQLARDLKTGHEGWIDRLAQENPDASDGQTANTALELAIQELEQDLPSDLPDAIGQLSLEDAMAFIRRSTPQD